MEGSPRFRRRVGAAITCLLAACTGGCQLAPQRTLWFDAALARPRLLPGLHCFATEEADPYAAAHEAYAEAIAYERECDHRCVDKYYEAAARTWTLSGADPQLRDSMQDSVRCLHESALVKAISTGQQFGRWQAYSGLTVDAFGRRQQVPVRYRGFLWQPHDFQQLLPVGGYAGSRLLHAFASDGVGVPLVVIRDRPDGQPFVPDRSAFSATVVLKPALGPIGYARHPGEHGIPLEIEFSDPLRRSTTEMGSQTVPLATDLTAPLAYQLAKVPRSYWEGFTRPSALGDDLGLYMVEPYQPGKIPVVFIHGLLSDRLTWVTMLNELRAAADFRDRYQVWAFEYPTGQAFLTSAARLRDDLCRLRQMIDPSGQDPALSEIVLIGHSMGGLVAKLQVTDSGDALWRAVANRPLSDLRLPATTRDRLMRNFFFQPSPNVTRVVFIGTPHQGSVDSQRLIAQLAASLVEMSPEQVMMHRQLIGDYPDVFSEEFTARVPTSIDLLEPSSGLLQAMYHLPVSGHVQQHSIVGNARWRLRTGPGDGVVPVSSAQHPAANSERCVSDLHTRLTQNPEVIEEVLAILRTHARPQ